MFGIRQQVVLVHNSPSTKEICSWTPSLYSYSLASASPPLEQEIETRLRNADAKKRIAARSWIGVVRTVGQSGRRMLAPHTSVPNVGNFSNRFVSPELSCRHGRVVQSMHESA